MRASSDQRRSTKPRPSQPKRAIEIIEDGGRRRTFQTWQTCLLALAHAVLFALALPPLNLWFLSPLIPAPLAWLAISARTTFRAVIIAVVAQWLMWLWLLRWIVPITSVGYPFLGLYLAVFAGLFVWVIRRLDRQPSIGAWPMALVLPTVWTGIEFLRGDVAFDGYPWYLIAHPLIHWLPAVQSADLFGTYFISFLAATFSGLAIDALRAGSAGSLWRRPIVTAIAIVAICIANVAYGMWRIIQTEGLTPGPRILALQTNLPQDNKVGWSAEDQARDVPAFIELTRQAMRAVGGDVDLVVWPETMVPGLGFDPKTLEHLHYLDRLGSNARRLFIWPETIEALHRELGTPILVGSEAWIDTSLRTAADGGSVRLEQRFTYNSAFLIQGEAPYQRYDKFFLTPFGETMPYISKWPWLERQFLTLGVGADLAFNLDSNQDIRLLELDWASQQAAVKTPVFLATPICFEDTVASLCRRMVYDGGVKRADIFINISNDGWFGESHNDRVLHAQIARFRCIESRIPMIRSVNTGASVAIDSAGRLLAAAGEGGYGETRKPGWVLGQVRLDARTTFYGRIGEAWGWTCLAATAVGLVSTWISKKKDQLP
jgi:apolipoprotein N-acyltransferase